MLDRYWRIFATGLSFAIFGIGGVILTIVLIPVLLLSHHGCLCETNLRKRKAGNMFLEFGMELYAHQEKYRVSFSYKDWRFDLDQYPGMPAYLEIEGKNEDGIDGFV